MERIDVDDGFSMHEYRAKLKLLKDNGDTRILEHRDDLGCPSCGQAFDRLFVTEHRTTSFDTPPDRPFCLARTDEKLLLITH
ncbi:DUF7385 family protein [Natronobacterium texcoconense]|uniref:Flagella cluster protein n=1 Tax=Natronobacterium texcoconense TaxID=1095778 RepID=A0A1H1ILG7_NATTX|nr:flagella cluster protein [Natronobacterium texcoconense]SDR38561.1 hypothetical protein SAMN04489842_3606 [Natronobacterium texcoconense]